MAETIFRGPGVIAGSLMDGRVEQFDGPSIGYQGDMIADPRFSPMAKDGLAPGRVKGFYNAFFSVVIDAIPSATNTSTIAAAQAPSTTAGVALNLKTAQAGTAAGVAVYAPGIPIVPLNGTSTVTVNAIDFGFATGTTAANSSTVVVTDNRIFSLGQWIVIAGAGSGSVTNSALFTQVAALSTNTTVLQISPVAATALNNAPIGQGNLYSQFLPPATQFGPAAASANAAEPYRLAGFGAVFDPTAAVARNIVVAAPTTVSGTGTFLVTGYDVYGALMAELITCTATPGGAGKKAFKYVSSITSQSAATTGVPANVSVGVGDIVGFPLRNDKWEYLDIFFNGGFSINSTGWTASITNQTNTSGDVRGTQNCSTILAGGTGGTAVAGGGFDGAKRLTIFQMIPPVQAFFATPTNSVSLFGSAQATA